MTDRRRAIPAVNALLTQAERSGLAGRTSRPALLRAIRETLDAGRQDGGAEPPGGWLGNVEQRIAEGRRLSLSRVINATGIILHTNLGRAPLADTAREALVEAAGYVALEYDLDEGHRGSRQDHTRRLLTELTGAEDAFVATNAAAGLFLTLAALAHGGSTIVSRSELVEIGGGFRIPEILARSGSRLVEVGTTNRVRAEDYETAFSPETRCVLKVHRSNFQITGFTSEVDVAALAGICAARNVPLVHDVGSGLMLSLEAFGLRDEPLVQQSVAAGAVTVFSGDKLLGGPQAGIIAGPSTLIKRIASDPLARALRPDKSTLAALEATLALYLDQATALQQVPILRMIATPPEELAKRARKLAKAAGNATLVKGTSEVGGGSFPGASLPTTLVAVETGSCESFLEALRRGTPPIIARASDGKIVFDPRTILDEEIPLVAAGIRAARG